MLQPKSLCHMNVIPPYRRSTLIPLVRQWTIVRKNSHQPRVWMELQDPKGRAMFPAKLLSHTASLTLRHTPRCMSLNNFQFLISKYSAM